MKGRFQVPIYAGENSIFSDGVAAQMVGQVTKAGDVILEARREGNQIIWLIVEKELPEKFDGKHGIFEKGSFSVDDTKAIGSSVPVFDRPTHVDHPDDERYDNVTIEIHERWKDSELSGDEWRFSYVVTAWRKGEQIVVSGWSRLDWALMALQHTLNIAPADGDIFNHEAWDRTKDKCDQPGCCEIATIFYKRLKPYTKSGDELVDHSWRNEYRQFCNRHTHRGDCGLDDADHNYILIDSPKGI